MDEEKLLNETEAAIKLGITKELLYAYVRNAPKKCLGETRKLKSIVKDGKNYFAEQELDAFDQYLKEPWSNPGEDRPPIPSYIQDYLKVENGGKCPLTGKGYPLQNAHIVDYSETRSHYHHNLIRISSDIHGKVDGNAVSKEELQLAKQKLIAELRARLRSEIISFNSTFRPPVSSSIFLEREQQLEELSKYLDNERLIIIEGLGGIGKTQLLLNALEKDKSEIVTIWLDIERYSKLKDLELILYQALQNHGLGNNQSSLVDQLNQLPIRVIFDGLEALLSNQNDECINFLVQLYTKSKKPKFIITSQIDLSTLDIPKVIMKLDGLSNDGSIKLIKQIIGDSKNYDNNDIKYLADFCDGHPLSLKLIGALLIFYGNFSIVKELIKQQEDLSNPIVNKPDKSSSLEAALRLVYNCLSIEQRKLLKYLVCFPGGCKLLWIPFNFKSSAVNRDIATLKQFFFIHVRTDILEFERAFILNPVRQFIRVQIKKEDIKEAIVLQREAIEGLMLEAMIVNWDYLELEKYDTPEFGLMRLHCDFPNFLEAFHITKWGIEYGKKYDENPDDYRVIKGGISSALGRYFFTLGLFNYGTIFSKEGIKVHLELNQIESACMQYMYLAQIQSRQFDLKGLEETSEALRILAEKTNNTEAKIDAEWCSGELNLDKENFDAALNHFMKAKTLLEKIIDFKVNDISDDDHFFNKNPEKGNLSIIISNIAKVYEFSGRYTEAIPYHLEAVRILKEVNSTVGLSEMYHHLGNCYSSTDNLQKAIEYYYLSIEGFLIFGQFEYIGNSISELGRYVEENPMIVDNNLISEKLLKLTLENLTNQITSFVQREKVKEGLENAIKKIPLKWSGKTILIIQFIGFTKYSYLLFDWAKEFISIIDLRNIGYTSLSSILNIGHMIGGVGYGHQLSTEMLKFLKREFLLLNGPDLKSKTYLFYWLASWMRHTELDKESTAEKLIKEAYDSLEDLP